MQRLFSHPIPGVGAGGSAGGATWGCVLSGVSRRLRKWKWQVGGGVLYAWLQEAWAGHGDTQVRSVGVDGGERAQTADWALCFWASSSKHGLWMQLGGQLGECCSSGCGRLESQPISRKEVTHTHHT